MISILPWRLDENDPSVILDSDGDIVAKDYKFECVDDFERLPKLVNVNKNIPHEDL